MLILCVWALAVQAATRFLPWSESTRTILSYADNLLCGLFFIDFVVTVSRARDRRRYFVTWGWLDLLSSIPTVDGYRGAG